MDSAYWAFEYEVFVFEPGEETGEDSPDVINGDFAEVASLLIFRKISANVISRHLRNGFLYCAEHLYYRVFIVCECL